MDKLTNLLSPTGRKALYTLLGAVATLLVVIGVVPDLEVTQDWIEVAVQALGVVGLILASIKAKRVDYTAFYAAGAALVGALTVAGVVNDGASSQIYDLMAQFAIALPMVTATLRTNTTVPTGEPLEEWQSHVARHGAGVEPVQVNERGGFDTGPLFTVAAVLVIIVCVILIVRWL